MTLRQATKRYTVQEYYTMERAAEYKSDYYKGEIFAMSGGTINHSKICCNIGGEARSRLRGKPCRAYESNLRLRSKLSGLRSYPDVSIYCGPFEYDDEDFKRETVTNPTVLFEVLSPSTESYDRGIKAANYRQIPSLLAYVLVSQYEPHVEIFERQTNGGWLLREEKGLESTLAIPAIGIDLPLREIYDGVDFTALDDTLLAD